MKIDGGNIRAVEEEIQSKLDMYAKMLQKSAEDCKEVGVDIEVKIICGSPIKKVIQQEASTCNATWVVLDRNLKRIKFYQGQIHCNLAAVLDNISINTMKPELTADTNNTEVNVVLYRSKHVQLSALQDKENLYQPVKSHRFSESFGSCENLEMYSKKVVSSLMHKPLSQSSLLTDDTDGATNHTMSGSLSPAGNNHTNSSQNNGNECGMTTQLYIKETMRFSYAEIHLATNYFSEENLLGEGDEAADVLTWPQIRAIAVGTAKRLRFLHEECPIIHRDLRLLLTHDFVPMLGDFGLAKWKTNDSPMQTRVLGTLGYLVPEYAEYGIVTTISDVYANGVTFMQLISGRKAISPNCDDNHQSLRQWLSDFGLAKWKTNDSPIHTSILGTLGYLAPGYADNGMVTTRTDVYAYGVTPIHHVSRRRAFSPNCDDNHQSLRNQAEPLVANMTMHDLIDLRLDHLYDPYELYHMAKTPSLCVKLDTGKHPAINGRGC